MTRELSALERFRFWNGDGDIRALWPHQRSAIALGIAYLRADRLLPNEDSVTEAALLKLPTGTGKSGVVAVLTRCVPHVRKALILTPRAALVDQMIKDVRHRFWSRLGFEAPEGATWSADGTLAGEPVEPAYIEQFLPNGSRLDRILKHRSQDRVVLVGTFQALDEIRRTVDAAERRRRRGQEVDADTERKLERYRPVLTFLRTFDLILVDEGHYEPAPSWSRSVRTLDRPTILLSATPFRNDYKFFRVRGRYVYNMPIHDAEEAAIIRGVEFSTLSAVTGALASRGEPHHDEPTSATAEGLEEPDLDSKSPRALNSDDIGQIDRFVEGVASALPHLLVRASGYHNSPGRTIIRAVGYEVLERLHAKVKERLGVTAVLVHERVGEKGGPGPAGHYRTVAAAKRDQL